MAKDPVNSWINSLKGKTQLAFAALAVFVVLFGLISYFISFLFGNSFYALFLPFVFLSATLIIFGRWLSKEISAPVEKVSLLAKSYERGVSTSIPKTSGSTETDELAQTIARLSAQVQKIVGTLDEVANGNLNVVFAQNSDSDRISQVFQKLLYKVSESIHAQQNLVKLQNAVLWISGEMAAVRNGNLNSKIESEADETDEISYTLNYLIEQLNDVVTQIKTNGAKTQNLAAETQKTIQAIVKRDEKRVQEMNEASVVLKQVPETVQQIFEELSQSSFSATQSIEKARKGTVAAQENLQAVGNLRRQIQEAIKNIQHFSQRTQEINKVSKMVQDLAQRAEMVALNASVQANGASGGESVRGFVFVSEEVGRLAKRAENTNKHISSLNKTIQIEIGDLEETLVTAVTEVAHLSKFAIETGGALGELEKYVAGVANLQNKIAAYSGDQTKETEQAFQTFVREIVETETSLIELKNSDDSLAKINAGLGELLALTNDFKTSLPSTATATSNLQETIASAPIAESLSASENFQPYVLSETDTSA